MASIAHPAAAQKLAQRQISAACDGLITQQTVTVNLAESPVSWLHARGHLDNRQFAAGELLRRDFEAARMMPSLTMRWDPVRHKRAMDEGLSPSERQMAARDRFHAALDHAGSDLADVLWRVACAGESLAVAERVLGWPARSGKLVLRIALDRIADFHRLPRRLAA